MDKVDLIAIKDLTLSSKNINVMFVILEAMNSTKTKENREVFSFKVAIQKAGRSHAESGGHFGNAGGICAPRC